MLYIRRQNGKVKYAFEPAFQSRTDDICSLPCPHKAIHAKSDRVPIEKWYIVHRQYIDDIVDIYVSKLEDIASSHPKYIVHIDTEELRLQLIEKLYLASQSKNKSFV